MYKYIITKLGEPLDHIGECEELCDGVLTERFQCTELPDGELTRLWWLAYTGDGDGDGFGLRLDVVFISWSSWIYCIVGADGHCGFDTVFWLWRLLINVSVSLLFRDFFLFDLFSFDCWRRGGDGFLLEFEFDINGNNLSLSLMTISSKSCKYKKEFIFVFIFVNDKIKNAL